MQFVHAKAARFPQTSQSGSAFKGRDADAADEGAVARADTDADADEAGEGEVGVGIVAAENGGTVAALDGFSPFFFVMAGCVGLEPRRSSKQLLVHPLHRAQMSEDGGGGCELRSDRCDR